MLNKIGDTLEQYIQDREFVLINQIGKKDGRYEKRYNVNSLENLSSLKCFSAVFGCRHGKFSARDAIRSYNNLMLIHERTGV